MSRMLKAEGEGGRRRLKAMVGESGEAEMFLR